MAYEDFINRTMSVIDKVAPEKKVRIKGNNQEWFDNEVHEAIRKRDKLFSKFKKTRLDIDNKNYNESRNIVQRLIKRKKKILFLDNWNKILGNQRIFGKL